MWPRMLLELLPHITRLVPAADKYFSSRSASERAQEAALSAMADGVRGDLGKLTAAHAGIYVELKEQSAQVAEAAAEAKGARLLAEAAEQRLGALETRMTVGIRLVAAVLVLLVAAVGLLGVVLVKLSH